MLICGLDVSYETGTSRVVAAAVTLELSTLTVVETALVHGEARFPYIPGMLAYREVPLLLPAISRLRLQPDVLVCDGYGIAHPRRFGLACHIGVCTELPTFGVAKTPFTTTFSPPSAERGSWSPLYDGSEVLGRVLRTQTGIKPVFVSVGHRITLEQATSLTLAMTPRFRQPECIRRADSLSRASLCLSIG